jgi:DNA-binding transcriptional LysR family regulator
VVRHGGFSAAARVTGIEKTRLSRRLVALEQRLQVRLLQRNTRHMALTAAGQLFYEQATAAINAAQAAYDSVEALRSAPAGLLRLSCPQVMAQQVVLPLLEDYLADHPGVNIELHADDRPVDLLTERFDLTLRALCEGDTVAGVVTRPVGRARRILVASPDYLARLGRPETPLQLPRAHVLCRALDVRDGEARWALHGPDGAAMPMLLRPRVVVDDMQLQMNAAIQGLGVALLPEPIVFSALRQGALERLLPAWGACDHHIQLLYLPPRGILPSVRSLIDYLLAHFPARLAQRTQA